MFAAAETSHSAADNLPHDARRTTKTQRSSADFSSGNLTRLECKDNLLEIENQSLLKQKKSRAQVLSQSPTVQKWEAQKFLWIDNDSRIPASTKLVFQLSTSVRKQ